MKQNLNTQFRPKKSYGQNFLVNRHVQERIVTACQLKPTDTVVEIGPGKGAITKLLINKVERLVIVEKDKTLVNSLQNEFDRDTVEIISGDFLKIDLTRLPKSAVIVGNLPYNVATAIIQKIIKFNTEHSCFRDLYFMVQLEHGKRMTAQPSTKQYGAFSCFVQYYTNPSILFKIGSSSFSPKPKVQSCFMHIEIPEQPKYHCPNTDDLFKTIHLAFNQRRKTIQNSLAPLADKSGILRILTDLKIDPKARAENLSINDFIHITEARQNL